MLTKKSIWKWLSLERLSWSVHFWDEQVACRSNGVFALWLDNSSFSLTRSKKSHSGVVDSGYGWCSQEDSPSTKLLVSTMAFQRLERVMSVQFRPHLACSCAHALKRTAGLSRCHSHHLTTGLSNNVFTFVTLAGSIAVSSKSRNSQCGRLT